MFSWKVIEKHTAESEHYQKTMIESFTNLPSKEIPDGKDLGVYFKGELIGGATLRTVTNLKHDADLDRYWDVNECQAGTRILRLWAKRRHRLSAIPQIFKAIKEVTDENVFFYGILAMPLGYAAKRSEIFSDNRGWLSAKLPLDECQWDPEAIATSEGQKLLGIYMGLGANFLGPASGSVEDTTVRVPMGLLTSALNFEAFARLV